MPKRQQGRSGRAQSVFNQEQRAKNAAADKLREEAVRIERSPPTVRPRSSRPQSAPRYGPPTIIQAPIIQDADKCNAQFVGSLVDPMHPARGPGNIMRGTLPVTMTSSHAYTFTVQSPETEPTSAQISGIPIDSNGGAVLAFHLVRHASTVSADVAEGRTSFENAPTGVCFPPGLRMDDLLDGNTTTPANTSWRLADMLIANSADKCVRYLGPYAENIPTTEYNPSINVGGSSGDNSAGNIVSPVGHRCVGHRVTVTNISEVLETTGEVLIADNGDFIPLYYSRTGRGPNPDYDHEYTGLRSADVVEFEDIGGLPDPCANLGDLTHLRRCRYAGPMSPGASYEGFWVPSNERAMSFRQDADDYPALTISGPDQADDAKDAPYHTFLMDLPVLFVAFRGVKTTMKVSITVETALELLLPDKSQYTLFTRGLSMRTPIWQIQYPELSTYENVGPLGSTAACFQQCATGQLCGAMNKGQLPPPRLFPGANSGSYGMPRGRAAQPQGMIGDAARSAFRGAKRAGMWAIRNPDKIATGLEVAAMFLNKKQPRQRRRRPAVAFRQ
jgi:hypothetical protein